jgi:hypothetical protein
MCSEATLISTHVVSGADSIEQEWHVHCSLSRGNRKVNQARMLSLVPTAGEAAALWCSVH